MAVTAFMATLTIGMILATATMGRFHSVGNSHSIISMQTRLATGKVTLALPAMKAAVNTAPERRADVAAAGGN